MALNVKQVRIKASSSKILKDKNQDSVDSKLNENIDFDRYRILYLYLNNLATLQPYSPFVLKH